MISYRITPLSVSSCEAFTEASKEELRVLLAIIECGGRIESADALAALAHTSRARANAAIVLWEEAGVLRAEVSDGEHAQTITEEFEERIRRGEIAEESAVNVAESIRKSSLADMISECTLMMKRTSLSSVEVKNIAALHEQYALSPEFIVTLAAYLAEDGKLTVTRLVNRAIQLVEREIDSPETLAEYIATTERESAAIREYRRIFGIYGRALSRTERECFARWSRNYSYSSDIVGEAYDIAVSAVSRGLVKYADKILIRWFESGCKTLEECRARYDKDLEEKRAQSAKPAQKPAQSKKPAERYGSFDAKAAFLAALDRSYPTSGTDDSGEK